MLTRFLPVLAVVLLSVLTFSGCEQQSASAGAAPPVAIPVGPVPGYGSAPVGETDPYINNPVALNEGRRLFVWYNCYGCHGGHGGGGMGPSLRDQTWIYGDTDAQIYNSIAQGRGKGMPAWGLKIPQDQIWQLVAYIKSMRTRDEPDPPR